MHRIPKGLDLSPLVGLEVASLSIAQHDVILRFHPEGLVRMEGAWILKDKNGVIIDESMEHADRDAWRIHKLLGSKITKCIVRDEQHLDLHLDDYVLEIEDDSDHYETFAIEHPSLKLYV